MTVYDGHSEDERDYHDDYATMQVKNFLEGTVELKSDVEKDRDVRDSWKMNINMCKPEEDPIAQAARQVEIINTTNVTRAAVLQTEIKHQMPGQRMVAEAALHLRNRLPQMSKTHVDNNVAMRKTVNQTQSIIDTYKDFQSSLITLTESETLYRAEQDLLLKQSEDLQLEFEEIARETLKISAGIKDSAMVATQKKMFRDADSYLHRLNAMKFEWPNHKHLRNRADLTSAAMQALGFPHNNNQLAVAICAAYRLENKVHRQIWTVPAG